MPPPPGQPAPGYSGPPGQPAPWPIAPPGYGPVAPAGPPVGPLVPGAPRGQPPYPPAPTAVGAGKRVWIIAAVAAGVLLLAACGVGAYLVVGHTGASKPPAVTDETRIRKLVEDFAAAVDRDDQQAILNQVCAAEAEDIMADDDFDPSLAPPANPPSVRPVTVADIQVSGDTASARVSRPSQPDVTLHFRKEGGAWKVCAPAGDPAEPSASASPTG